MATKVTLYEQLGGDGALQMALDRFYLKVMADPRVAVFFEGVDIARVKAKQKAFFTIALGGEGDYDGRDLGTAHRAAVAKGLDEEVFDVFVGHFRETLEELGVEEPQIEQVMAHTYAGREEVLSG